MSTKRVAKRSDKPAGKRLAFPKSKAKASEAPEVAEAPDCSGCSEKAERIAVLEREISAGVERYGAAGVEKLRAENEALVEANNRLCRLASDAGARADHFEAALSTIEHGAGYVNN
jgi:hypothetical protein